MNEKPITVDIGFNEALRRIANTSKGVVVETPIPKPAKKYAKVKTAPNPKKGRG